MYEGIDGFLGSRGSIMLDVVVLGMAVVLPAMGGSILLAKRGNYLLHRNLQLTLGVLLLVVVGAFELDMRLNGWRHRAEESPYYATEDSMGLVDPILYVHLFFSITTVVLWIVVITRALRNFDNPPVPSAHSAWHLRWARLAAYDMILTAVTGWIFYYVAFVAGPT